MGLAVEKSLRGLFAVKDAVKPGAREVVQELERQGLRIYLVTGDNALTAKSIAEQTGIGRRMSLPRSAPSRRRSW